MNASSLQPFGPDIWLAAGPEVQVICFRYPTRMAVIRLSDGGLFIWSPVALSDALRRDLSDLGEVRHLVAPNSLHHLFLAEWRAAYPEAKLYAAPGLRRRRSDLKFGAELGDAPSPEWAGDLAVLFTDLLQVAMAHGPPVEQHGQAFIARAFRWLTG